MFARGDSKGLGYLLAALAALVLVGCGSSTGAGAPIEPGSAPSADTLSPAPSLSIVSPKPGDSVQAPVQVEYIISGLDPELVARYRLRVTVGSPPVSTADLSLSGLRGTAFLADDKFTPGLRDLIFSLVRIDGTAVANPATVKISGVTIVGRR